MAKYEVNIGDTIYINKPKKSNEEVITRTFSNTCQHTPKLSVEGVNASVEIYTNFNNNNVEVKLEGVASDLDLIKVAKQGDVVVVSSSGNSISSRGSNISIGNINGAMVIGNNMSISNGVVRINGTNIVVGSDTECQTKVIVSIPRGASINLDGVQGNTMVGNIEGDLDVLLNGDSELEAGKLKSACLQVMGSGSVVIDYLTDSLSASVMGNGDVIVKDGKINNLTASVMGNSDVNYRGVATNANLSAMGNGNIRVRHVTNRPNKRCMGNGDIEVDNW